MCICWQCCSSKPPSVNEKTMIRQSKSFSSHLGTYIRHDSHDHIVDLDDYYPPSFSGTTLSLPDRRSGGGLVFHRIAKRLSKINRKGNGDEREGKGEEKSGEANSAKERSSGTEVSGSTDGGGVRERKPRGSKLKKQRPRSSSVSNLDSIDG